ncbi:MAG: peptide ABC transporter [Clostridiales bacterium]|uniref:ABC transporter substrate-binding protein n=1 Tax=Clostridium sp. N3C TaxID=1776758 RepID=UPI00092E1BDB|nr:ABC transporter substrate-binding protein [Clostridium sp. N3C]NLZ47948.1 peptide ABC transporter [Clostridiales bacterium]SCN22451.1 Oligopeptide-binding protein AppA precursor [Clostridium sp. N3C]
MKRALKLLIASSITTFMLSGCIWNGGKNQVRREQNKYEEIITIGRKRANPKVAKNREDTLVVAVNDFSGSKNPLYTTNGYDLWLSTLIFEGLVCHDQGGKIINNIAKKWEVSEDGKKYTFYLVEGIKFSDGSELTAEDVAFTYTALCDPSYKGPFVNSMRLLEGYDYYKYGSEEEVIGIEVEDKYKISFTFREVNSSLIYDFEFGILPKKYYNFTKGQINEMDKMIDKPVGCGPYCLQFSDGDKEVKLIKNEYYWKDKPKINNIIFKKVPGDEALRQLASGEVDIAKFIANDHRVEYLKTLGYVDLHIFDSNSFQYIGLNLRNPKFQDIRVRKALIYGLNREKLIKEVYGNYGSTFDTPLAKCSWAYPDNLTPYLYDKKKAEELLEECEWTKREDGYRYDKNGNKFEIKWSTYGDTKYAETLRKQLVEDWKEIGIEVIVEEIPFSDLMSKIYDERDFEMYNMSWALTQDPDPSEIFSIKEDYPGGYNTVGWRNMESDKLIYSALKESDMEKRGIIYSAWAKLANEDLPYIYLCQNKELLGVNIRVKGVNVSPYKEWTQDAYKLELDN